MIYYYIIVDDADDDDVVVCGILFNTRKQQTCFERNTTMHNFKSIKINMQREIHRKRERERENLLMCRTSECLYST